MSMFQCLAVGIGEHLESDGCLIPGRRLEAALQLEALQGELGGIANDAFRRWATWAATCASREHPLCPSLHETDVCASMKGVHQ